MRKTLTTISAVVAIAGISPSHAQVSFSPVQPICASYTDGMTNCGFQSFAQCLQAVSGVGGTCGANTYVALAYPPIDPRTVPDCYDFNFYTVPGEFFGASRGAEPFCRFTPQLFLHGYDPAGIGRREPAGRWVEGAYWIGSPWVTTARRAFHESTPPTAAAPVAPISTKQRTVANASPTKPSGGTPDARRQSR